MDMGGPSTSAAARPSCKISMLWNWYTVNACFISRQWHIRSNVAFAFSVICVFLLVALVEGVRRAGREYDRYIVHQARKNSLSQQQLVASELKKDGSNDAISTPFTFKPTWSQQAVRALLFGVQFGAAYILMLLAMYYNGYMIMAIILGGTAGFMVFSSDTVAFQGEDGKGAICC